MCAPCQYSVSEVWIPLGLRAFEAPNPNVPAHQSGQISILFVYVVCLKIFLSASVLITRQFEKSITHTLHVERTRTHVKWKKEKLSWTLRILGHVPRQYWNSLVHARRWHFARCVCIHDSPSNFVAIESTHSAPNPNVPAHQNGQTADFRVVYL